MQGYAKTLHTPALFLPFIVLEEQKSRNTTEYNPEYRLPGKYLRATPVYLLLYSRNPNGRNKRLVLRISCPSHI